MSDGAIGGAGIVATVRSSVTTDGGARVLREVGTRRPPGHRTYLPPCKVEWDDQMVDQVSQAESGSRSVFDVSQDGKPRFRIFFAISVRAGSAHGEKH